MRFEPSDSTRARSTASKTERAGPAHLLHEQVEVPPGDAGRELLFPGDVQARWLRVVADRDCTATAWLTYR